MTITIDLVNKKALNLLRDMEVLNLIRLQAPVTAPGEPADEDWFENGGECPLCAVYHEPNEETIAAFEEGDAILRGEKPAKWYTSFDEMWEDLHQ